MRVSAKRDRISQSLAGESAAVAVFERDRIFAAELDIEARRKMEFDGLFSRQGLYEPMLASVLRELGIALADFVARIQTNGAAMRLLGEVPNLDVLLTLRLARDRDFVRPIARNDIRDLDWISVALPYSNCVVMENYWHHQVCTTGLDAKYGAVILTDLRQLPEQLRTMGCIA